MLVLLYALVGCNPIVTDVEPLFGPVTGGTEMVFSVEGLSPRMCTPGNVLLTSGILSSSLLVYVLPIYHLH